MGFNIRTNKIGVINRTYKLAGILALIFSVLIIRLAYVQMYKKSDLQVMANNQYYYEENAKDLKFKLQDRNGKELFDFDKKYYAVIDPGVFKRLNGEENVRDIQTLTYYMRDYNKDYDISLIRYDDSLEKKYYEINKETFDKLNNITSVKGFYVYETEKSNRKDNWKIENILSSGTRYDDKSKLKDKGTLEREIHEYIKNNKYPKVRFEKDVSGNIIDKKVVENNNNVNVKLTLDKEVQKQTEDILRSDKYKEHEQIGVVMMEAETGKIIAMAQKDDFSPVNTGVPTGNGFLMGSIFKAIVYEAALDEDKITHNEVFNVKGIFKKSKQDEYKSSYTTKEAFTISSNDVFAQIGRRVGIEKLFEYAENQNLCSKILNLQDEAQGNFEEINSIPEYEIIDNASIGQKIRSTPIAALTIPNTAVTGGIYVKPRIIDSIVKEDGTIIKEYESEKKRVVYKSTAQIIKEEMIGVVNGSVANHLGTGNKARLEGVEIGGKTGTTEYGPKDENNKYKYSDAWFAGFFKQNNRYYSMVVFIPQLGHQNNTGYIFKDIVKSIKDNNYLK